MLLKHKTEPAQTTRHDGKPMQAKPPLSTDDSRTTAANEVMERLAVDPAIQAMRELYG